MFQAGAASSSRATRCQAGSPGRGRRTSSQERTSPVPSGSSVSEPVPPSPPERSGYSGTQRDRRHSLPLGLSTPLSPLNLRHSVTDTPDNTPESRSSNLSSASPEDKFTEKFPHVGVDIKSSLASSISHNVLEASMSPLWEDRYVQPHAPAHTTPLVAPVAPARGQWVTAPGNWEERKTRRQFLNKLQKVDLYTTSKEEVQPLPIQVTVTQESTIKDNGQQQQLQQQQQQQQQVRANGRGSAKLRRKTKKPQVEKGTDECSPRSYDAGVRGDQRYSVKYSQQSISI